MNKRSTTIALNGRLYDVKTGRPLSNDNLRAPQKRTVQNRTKTVDGFMRPHTTRSVSPPAQKKNISEPKKSKNPHQKAAEAHKVHQKTVKTRTLMRSSVQKPAPSKIHGVKANSKSIGEAVQAVLHQKDLHKKRLDHAKQIPKSKFISKFGNDSETSVSKQYSTSLGVQPAPSMPSVSQSNVQTHHPSPSFHMVQNAINNAVSHQQTSVKKHGKKLGFSRKTLNIGAISAIIVVIAGFTAMHNSANLSMKVAANRSGVAGSLPSYKPDGFSLKPLQYDRGQIVLTYRSNSDSGRAYSITQTTSNWSNSDLEQRYLSANQPTYQRYEYKDGVFYVHDGNATWLKNGTWYNLSSQAQLSNDQLLKVASSF